MGLPYLMQASPKDDPGQRESPGVGIMPWSQTLLFPVLDPFKLGEKNKKTWSSKGFVCKQQIVKNQLSVFVP